MYYSGAMGGWQLIEERIDEGYASSPGVNRVAQEVWGLRYIDDAVMRINNAADEAERLRFYHLTDVQFSTVAMIGLGGTYPPLMERVSYDPYGRATHRWAGDVNNDGAVDSTDAGLVKDTLGNAIGDAGYDVRMDFDRDGDIDSDDKDIADAALERAALMAGEISDRSSTGPDNVFGYDGYVFAPETQRYCVRFRWYDPVVGRWMERDPAGYVDGPSLFGYAKSSPAKYADPVGKRPEQPGLVDPSSNPKHPGNNKALGCGIKVKQADVIVNGYGHQWIEIDDPGRGKPGDKDYRPGTLRRVGRQPQGWISPYRDPNPGCPTCQTDDVPAKEGADTEWDTAPIPSWKELATPNVIHDKLENGPYATTPFASATCEQIRMCLYKASAKRDLYDYTGHIYGENCRNAAENALLECGLGMVNKRRTASGKAHDSDKTKSIIQIIIESGLPIR